MSYRPRHLSVSMVELFERCPRAFHVRYVLGRPPERTPAMLYGTLFGRALEALALGADDPYAGFLRGWEALRRALGPAAAELPPVERGFQQLRRFAAEYLPRHAGGVPERRFQLQLPAEHGVDLPVLGYLDLDTEECVVEYKTARGGWSAARAAARHQTHVYGWAHAVLHGRARLSPVQYYVFPTAGRDALAAYRVEATAEGLARFAAACRALLAAVAAGDYARACGDVRWCAACRAAAAPADLARLQAALRAVAEPYLQEVEALLAAVDDAGRRALWERTMYEATRVTAARLEAAVARGDLEEARGLCRAYVERLRRALAG